MQLNINKNSEKVIYLIFWILVFTFPVLLSPGRGGIDWSRVLREWTGIIPFLLIFLVHNFVLFGFFKTKKYGKYLVYTAIVVVVFSLPGSFNSRIFEILNLSPPPKALEKLDTMRFLNLLFYNSIISILVIGLNNAIKITFNWLEDQKNYEQLQKENLNNQLSILRHQINPHFFMNTLNNIHALIDYDQEIAKNSVVKLSKLMRVLLYEVETENFTLQKEINFLKDYIELMRIRVNEDVEIELEYPQKVIPDLKLPPLLFINFVENAFKHGIKATGKSFIHISFVMEDPFLSVTIKNSKSVRAQFIRETENIGLSNSQKRLALIYNNRHEFNISETDTTYQVNVKIPIHEN